MVRALADFREILFASNVKIARNPADPEVRNRPRGFTESMFFARHSGNEQLILD